MQTDFPVPDGPRIIEIFPSGIPMFRPRRIWLRPNALCTSTNSTASCVPVGRFRPVCQRYSSSSLSPASRTTDTREGGPCGGTAGPPRGAGAVGGRGGAAGGGGLGRGLVVVREGRVVALGLGVAVAGALEALVVVAVHAHPPIGARGFAPQNSWVPSIPMRCTSTMFITIDFAVAVPPPTGPPLAL